MRRIIFFTVLLIIGGYGFAQNITRFEYFFNTDPGFGEGTQIVVSNPQPDISKLDLNIPINSLSNGFNRLYIRSIDENGVWSATVQRTIYKHTLPPSENPYKVSRIEYFFDTDPGFDNGTDVSFNQEELWDKKSFVVDITSLSNGFHRLFFRSVDNSGKWSLTTSYVFYKLSVQTQVGPFNVNKIEYFFNSDPGFGKGKKLEVNPLENIEKQDFILDLSELSNGFHTLVIRSSDDKGSWSTAVAKIFYKSSELVNEEKQITAIKYFFDTDPGYGGGFNMDFTQGAVVEINSEVDISSLQPGFHKLFIRAKDNKNSWSTSMLKMFYCNRVPDTEIPNLVYGEYFFNTDPGFGKGTELNFSQSTDLANQKYTIDLAGIPDGFNSLNIRFRDAKKRWSVNSRKLFYKQSAPQTLVPNLKYCEYYIDDDPGYDKGTRLSVFSGNTNFSAILVEIPINSISAGFHKLYLRARDAQGKWGQTIVRSFYKDITAPNLVGQIKEIEYFIGQNKIVDLETGKKVAVATPDEHVKDFIFEIDLESRPVGSYYIYSIAKNSIGQFSHTVIDSFKICNNVARANFSYTVASRTVTFTDLSELAADYLWNFGDGSTTTVPEPVKTYSVNGKYNVCLTVSNDCNSSTFCEEIEVVYNAPPTSQSFNANSNENQNYTFAYTSFNYYDAENNALDHILISNLALATGDVLKVNETTVNAGTKVNKNDIGKLVYTPAANQFGFRGSISFRVNDGISYSDNTYTVNFYVAEVNDPATFTVDNTAIIVVESSGTVTLSNWLKDLKDAPNESGSVTASVQIIDGNNLFTTQPQLQGTKYADLYFVVKASTTGMSRCKLYVYDTGTNPYQNTQTVDFTIEVRPFKAEFSASKTKGCVGDQITFTTTSPTQGVSFAWDFGSGANPATFIGSTPGPVEYSTSGNKEVKLTISGYGKSDIKTASIEILENPVSSFYTESNKYPLFDSVFFYNTSTGGLEYSWNFGDNSPVLTKATTETVWHKYNAQAGSNYTVVLTATRDVCYQTSQQVISFIDAQPPIISEENFATNYSISQTKPVSIVASDPFYGIRDAKFYYKGISGNRWNSRTLTPTSNQFTTTIEETMGDQVGIMYYFDVFNTLGIKRKSTVGFAYLQFEEGLSLPTITGGVTAADYQIVSVPLTLEYNHVDSVFNELGDHDVTQWRLFHYTPSKLLEYPADFQTIEKGKGYWLITRKSATINTGSGATHSGSSFDTYRIPLRKGWTQIGNPYIFDVSWADIEATNQADIDHFGVLRTYNKENFEDATTLKAFSGGFVFAEESGIELVIPVKANSSKKLTEVSQDDVYSGDNWKIAMNLSAKNITNKYIGFGMHKDASISKDRYDQMSSPRFLNFAEANFKHTEYFYPNFSTDIVPVNDSHIWEFNVETNHLGEYVTLTWDLASANRLNNQVSMIDTRSFKVINMKEVGQYKFYYDSPRSFKIIYGNQQFLDSNLVFSQSLLGDCYPNPFSQRTIIPVFVKGGQKGVSSIELSIYSVDGRKVQTIAKGDFKQGYYEFEWSINSQVGQKPGVYLYTFKNSTDGTSITKKMVIIR
jgi:PKD repeat protein